MTGNEVTHEDLLAFVGGDAGSEVKRRIAAEMEVEGSYTHRWLKRLTRSARDPFDVGWGRLASCAEADEMQEIPVAEIEDEVGSSSDIVEDHAKVSCGGPNRTDLAPIGAVGEQDREFRECLPAPLDRMDVLQSQPNEDRQAITVSSATPASPSAVVQELLRGNTQEPQVVVLTDEQRNCVRFLQGTPALSMRELVERVSDWRIDCGKVPLSPARLSESLQDADWLFQRVLLDAPAPAGVRGGLSQVGGFSLKVDAEEILRRTCGPLLARMTSDPQARQAVIDYAIDLGLSESYIQNLREAK